MFDVEGQKMLPMCKKCNYEYLTNLNITPQIYYVTQLIESLGSMWISWDVSLKFGCSILDVHDHNLI